MQYCPSAAGLILCSFEACFTTPGYRNFQALVVGWLLVHRHYTISRIVRVVRRLGWEGHHSALYRFLSAGRWSLDALGQVVFQLFEGHLEGTVLAIVDDTLCAKSGRQIFGTGIHLDITRSVYSRRVEAFSFGHNWVVLAIDVRCPWRKSKGWAVPVLFRLYRAKKSCPQRRYRKRSELARELITELARWLPADKRLCVAGDAAYCCKTVLRSLPEGVDFVGPLPLDAALYALPRHQAGARGRPRRRGHRLVNPRTRLANKAKKDEWSHEEIDLYGRPVSVGLFSQVCVWYTSAGPDPVRIVITRDGRGKKSDGRAYVSTNPELDPATTLRTYARRWQLEVTFRDLKQDLGFEDARNGWWRRPAGKRDNACRRALRRETGRQAVERTAPLAALIYAWTLRWYFDEGDRANDLERIRKESPWYRHKTDVSFADMLRAFRRQIWLHQFRRRRLLDRLDQKTEEAWMLANIAA